MLHLSPRHRVKLVSYQQPAHAWDIFNNLDNFWDIICTGAADLCNISSVSSGSPVSDYILAPFENVITMYVTSVKNLALMVNCNVSDPYCYQFTLKWVRRGSNKTNHIATKVSTPADTMSCNNHGQEDSHRKKRDGDY